MSSSLHIILFLHSLLSLLELSAHFSLSTEFIDVLMDQSLFTTDADNLSQLLYLSLLAVFYYSELQLS